MSQKLRAILISLTLAVITLAVYWPATHFDFINFDDPEYIIYNTPIQQGITRASLAWAFKASYASNWHPLTWVSHMVDCSLYELRPGGHHLTSLLFHDANAVLLFLVLWELTGSQWRSALVAALFAWHPLHVESVAWISERKDVLSTFFWLLTMAAYGRYARALAAKTSSVEIYYLAALVCFSLGLLSKPMVVTLPLVLLLLDVWPLRRWDGAHWRKLVREKLPFFALAALDCLITFYAQRGTNSIVSVGTLPFYQRVATALSGYALYLWKTLWPVNLAVPYPYGNGGSLWLALGAAVLLALITAGTVKQFRQRPYLLVGWLWFLGTMVPMIGLVQVGIQFMADRYTYMPLTGIFIMVAWAIPASWAQWPRPGFIFGATLAGVLLFLLTGTEVQLQYWRNSVTLFSHTAAVTRDNILAEYNLGEALARQGDEDDAIVHYQKAIAMRPNRVEAQYNSQVQAHYNLGLIYRTRKKWPEAEAQFRACIEIDPKLARAHDNLGVTLVAQGHDNDGRQEFQTAAQLDQRQLGDAEALAMLDTAYAEAGRYAEALATAKDARDAALLHGRGDLARAAEERIKSYSAAKH